MNCVSDNTQAGRQAGRQTDRQTGRQTGTQTEKYRDKTFGFNVVSESSSICFDHCDITSQEEINPGKDRFDQHLCVLDQPGYLASRVRQCTLP
ncbi:hypothetical protein PoB_000633600 [Plakobranchus ocellatus]|uniref:Uncharacterized protein n=1 Tax=Plakobranchus ocellatus TaxID=259542 RepID=A0AAV3Y9D3_9GAST|nr:hypothetical protein PoB_000633600 [Plakobranchus ocellatus]